LESWVVRILLRQHRAHGAPRNGEIRIVPEDAALVVGSVVVAALVEKLDDIGQRQEAVRKSGGNINLILLGSREKNAGPLAKVRRAETNVDGDVQSFALNYPTEFCLGMMQLVVKTAQRSEGGTRVVVFGRSNPQYQD
jgi:hypothetical protein